MLAGVILGIAVDDDRISTVRSDDPLTVETWTFDGEKKSVPLGERVVTAAGVMQVRALRDGVRISEIKLACSTENAAALQEDPHLDGIGTIETIEFSSAYWAGIRRRHPNVPAGQNGVITLNSGSAVAQLVDPAGGMRVIAQRELDSAPRSTAVGPAVDAEIGLLNGAAAQDLERVFVAGRPEDEAAVSQLKPAVPVTFVGEPTALAAVGATGDGIAKVSAKPAGPRHAARHAAPPAPKRRWFRK